MTREERKRRAEEKKIELAKEMADQIRSSLDLGRNLGEAIRDLDPWLSLKMRDCPQESELIRQAAIEYVSALVHAIKKKDFETGEVDE